MLLMYATTQVQSKRTSDFALKLGLHVNLVTRGNEAAAASAPFAHLRCTQEKRGTHEWRLLLPRQCHPAGVQPLELLQVFSKVA